MIYGYIKNNKLEYQATCKVIDNNNYFLAIDGDADDSYYNEIIKQYKKKKYKFINEIKDFISIFLYDKKKNKMLLVNDRIGAKKIYYYLENNTFYFSNNLDKMNIKKDINIDALSLYFRCHYIHEPNTIYKDVYKLEHGYYLIYDKEIKKYNYWNLIEKFNNRKISDKSFDILEKELDNKITNKIKELTKNKDNIGVYLSSGVDSSVVAALYKTTNNNVNTFSMGFDEENIDESKSSKEIAKYLDSNHHEYIIKDTEALKIVKRIPDYYCEPFGDVSAVATILLNEIAAKNKIEYALTGDGADQLFCGANMYETLYKIKRASIINPLHIQINGKYLKNRKLFYIFGKVDKKYKTQVERIYKERNLESLFKDTGEKRFEYEMDINTNNLQEKRMILDLNTYSAERVFPKMCLAAKGNNIKVISPYLTHEIIEYSFTIPHKYKYHNRDRKYILKKVLYNHIPESLYSKKKRGFCIPTSTWLKTALYKDLTRLSTKSFLKKQNIFNYDKVQSLLNDIDNNANIVWDYYIFQLWYEKHF